MSRWIALFALTLAALAASAEYRTDPQQYEKILLPITNSATGPNGASWAVSMVMKNSSDRPVDVFPVGRRGCVSSASCFHSIHEAPTLGPEDRAFNDHPLPHPLPIGNSDFSAPGSFLYVERDAADQLSLEVHVADLRRRPIGLGTRIPVVREADFFESACDITAVPVLERTRIALRIYERELHPGSQVRIRIFETAAVPQPGVPGGRIPPRLLVEDVVPFVQTANQTHDALLGTPQGFQYKPGYIQITDLLARYPVLAEAMNRDYGVSIRIEPLTPDLAFWPMVSVTEVDTSVVTLFTVQ